MPGSLRIAVLAVVLPILVVYAFYDHPSFPLFWFTNLIPDNSHKLLTNTDDYTFTRHIVAVGDLHGDLANAERVLRFAGVVDDFGDWSGDVDFFVQTGDIIDR